MRRLAAVLGLLGGGLLLGFTFGFVLASRTPTGTPVPDPRSLTPISVPAPPTPTAIKAADQCPGEDPRFERDGNEAPPKLMRPADDQRYFSQTLFPLDYLDVGRTRDGPMRLILWVSAPQGAGGRYAEYAVTLAEPYESHRTVWKDGLMNVRVHLHQVGSGQSMIIINQAIHGDNECSACPHRHEIKRLVWEPATSTMTPDPAYTYTTRCWYDSDGRAVEPRLPAVVTPEEKSEEPRRARVPQQLTPAPGRSLSNELLHRYPAEAAALRPGCERAAQRQPEWPSFSEGERQGLVEACVALMLARRGYR